MNANYVAGRAKEYQVKHQLEKAGYTVFRMAGSHGVCDLIAIDANQVLLIQVKRSSGSYKISDEDKITFKGVAVPSSVIKEIWTYTKGVKNPFIERI